MKKLWLFLLLPFCLFGSSWVDDTNAYSYKIGKKIGGKNAIISPFSTRMCLLMPYVGSNSTTEEAMRNTLCVSDSYAIPTSLWKRLKGETLVPASSAWVAKDLKLLHDFYTPITQSFEAGIYSADYSDSVKAARAMNDWISYMTSGVIPTLVEPGHLSQNTKLTLISTLYFKNNWLTPFDPTKTKNETFHTQQGPKTVPMMHASEMLPYVETDAWQSILIPLKPTGNISLMICLPKDGIPTPLPPSTYKELLNGMIYTSVDLALPKFSIEKSINMNDLLQKLGMGIAFSNDADFSKITGDKSLALSTVITKTKLSLDENGLCAAAASAAIMNCKCAYNPNVATFIASRPFLFYLIDQQSQLILFQGEMWNP